MRTGLVQRVTSSASRAASQHILGLAPESEAWPEPSDVNSLPVGDGIDHSSEFGPAWVVGPEFSTGWPKRRTVIGAHAYRFEVNAEYDCGWRLVDLAERFLRTYRLVDGLTMMTIVPPPPVHTPVPVLNWSARRLGERLSLPYRPELIPVHAPYAVHPDRARDLPMPPSRLFALAEDRSLKEEHVLLLDWRWHQGRTISTIAQHLHRAGATVVRFAWLG